MQRALGIEICCLQRQLFPWFATVLECLPPICMHARQATATVAPIWSNNAVPEWAKWVDIGVTVIGKVLVRYTPPYMVLLYGAVTATAKIKVRLLLWPHACCVPASGATFHVVGIAVVQSFPSLCKAAIAGPPLPVYCCACT